MTFKQLSTSVKYLEWEIHQLWYIYQFPSDIRLRRQKQYRRWGTISAESSRHRLCGCSRFRNYGDHSRERRQILQNALLLDSSSVTEESAVALFSLDLVQCIYGNPKSLCPWSLLSTLFWISLQSCTHRYRGLHQNETLDRASPRISTMGTRMHACIPCQRFKSRRYNRVPTSETSFAQIATMHQNAKKPSRPESKPFCPGQLNPT